MATISHPHYSPFSRLPLDHFQVRQGIINQSKVNKFDFALGLYSFNEIRVDWQRFLLCQTHGLD
jgi:hypothetical protein